jgi:hypothetical protein
MLNPPYVICSTAVLRIDVTISANQVARSLTCDVCLGSRPCLPCLHHRQREQCWLFHQNKECVILTMTTSDLFREAEGGKNVALCCGEADETGGTSRHPNSGNAIGNGWQNFRELFGGVSDEGGVLGHVIYGVTQGDVYWYRYKVKARQILPVIAVGIPARERLSVGAGEVFRRPRCGMDQLAAP